MYRIEVGDAAPRYRVFGPNGYVCSWYTRTAAEHCVDLLSAGADVETRSGALACR